jgi:hypothetical protein
MTTNVLCTFFQSVWFFVVLVAVALYEQGEGTYEASLLLILTLYSTASFFSYFSLVSFLSKHPFDLTIYRT